MKRDRKLQAIIIQNLRVFGAYWLPKDPPGGPGFPAAWVASCFSMSGGGLSFLGGSAWIDWSVREVERLILDMIDEISDAMRRFTVDFRSNSDLEIEEYSKRWACDIYRAGRRKEVLKYSKLVEWRF